MLLPLTIKDGHRCLQHGRTGDQLQVIHIGHQQVVADVAEAVQPGRGAQQQLHQPHKLAGNVGREGREALQRALLQWREGGREGGVKKEALPSGILCTYPPSYCSHTHVHVGSSYVPAHQCTCIISYRDKANASNDARGQLIISKRKRRAALGGT